MRVATRRLRSTFRSFEPLLDGDALTSLASELRWLTGELGAVRDGEVLYAALRADVEALPVELVLGPVAARLHIDVLAPTLRARESLLETLSSTRYTELLDALDAVCAEPPFLPVAAEPARAVLPRLLRRALRTTRRQLAAAAALPAPEREVAAHRARRSAKRLRYAAEAVADVVGTPATRLAALGEEVQEVLGIHQDDAVARAELRRVALRAHAAGENALTYGVLIGRAAARADQLGADVERLRSTLDKRSLRRALHAG
jgi:CHAD domain-containing protein